MTTGNVARCIIAPTIGIARLGNSPDEYFIGPESPQHPPMPIGGFKDKGGLIKRQAARFRIYGLDESGKVVGEITAAHARLSWRVHLANRKAAWHEFKGRFHPDTALRNADIQNTPERPHARDVLIIDPGPRAIGGRNQSGSEYRFDSGSFMGRPVPLGELRSDARGRLLVLGGFGHSASVQPDNPIHSFANNDGWHDDASDGPVHCTVTLADGRQLEATSARVIVAPPNFAPEIDNPIPLYEVVREAAVASGRYAPQRCDRPSFRHDIYPLLRRIAQLQWVNRAAQRGHGPGRGGDFLAEDKLRVLSSTRKAAAAARKALFDRIRNPRLDLDSEEAKAQANYFFMPQLAGDDGDPVEGSPKTWLRFLESQYAALEKWAAGDFQDDWKEAEADPPAIDEMALDERPHALLRAALEPCVGGPFYPGIEMTYVAGDPELYAEPFRLRDDIEPGGITKYMAVPWQGDFYECNTHWWPAQRPDDVVPETEFQQAVADARGTPHDTGEQFHADALPGLAPPAASDARQQLAGRAPWARGLENYYHSDVPGAVAGANAMVALWSELGFVTPKSAPGGEPVFVESERHPFAGLSNREFYYYLANIDSFPEFMPKAKWLADHYLQAAWNRQQDGGYPDLWRYFPYSHEAFEARLDRIYNELVQDARRYDPATDKIFQTRDDVLERLTQFAPFNQNDGAWIHKVTPAGPLDEVQMLLFSIWMDEAGEGRIERSHCNVYTDLLHSVGIYLPDPRSRAYAFDKRIMDSAYEIPLLQLAISQFPQAYFPELLGFTLELEWTVPGLRPVVALLDYHGISSHFYRLHVGIDNAASGHGARAKQAVQMYLDQVRREGGDEAVQAHWRRIWNGFLAFGDTGTMGEDLVARIKQRHDGNPVAAVKSMIQRKAPRGSLNHGEKMLGANRINDWFRDPEGLMTALVESELIVKGDPDHSPFFQLTGFNGPMFKVFTEEELQLWRSWARWLAIPHQPVHVDPAMAMAATIEALRMRQVGVAAHQSKKLKGPDPRDPSVQIEESVTWWFDQVRALGPRGTVALMCALSDPDNGMVVKGDPESSVFVNDLLAPNRPMGAAFASTEPGTGGLERREIAIRWIAAGCPIPHLAEKLGPAKHYSLQTPPPEASIHPRPRIRGMGAIH